MKHNKNVLLWRQYWAIKCGHGEDRSRVEVAIDLWRLGGLSFPFSGGRTRSPLPWIDIDSWLCSFHTVFQLVVLSGRGGSGRTCCVYKPCYLKSGTISLVALLLNKQVSGSQLSKHCGEGRCKVLIFTLWGFLSSEPSRTCFHCFLWTLFRIYASWEGPGSLEGIYYNVLFLISEGKNGYLGYFAFLLP